MNEVIVEAFLEAVRALDERAWADVARDRSVSEATYGRPDIVSLEETLRSAGVLVDGERLLERALALATGDGPEQWHRRSMIGLAASALYAEDALAPAAFAALYGPFAQVIPLSMLDLERVDLALPAGLAQRFVARVMALTEPEWQQVVDLTMLREDAVGAAAIERAIQDGIDADCDLEPAYQDLKNWWQSQGPFAGTASLWQALGRSLSKDDYFAAGAYATRMADREDIVWAAVQQALLAVCSREATAAQTVAILYLPFGGIVPFDTLS